MKNSSSDKNISCIYCRSEITKDNKSEEHVFPKAFGCPKSWYIECVCKCCNIKLGETIDRVLASDSLWGVLRLQRIGSRSKKHVRQKRTKINLPDNEKYGVYAGAIIYVDFSAIDTIILPNQIVIDDKNEKRRFLVGELEDPKIEKEILKYKGKYFRILAQDQEGEEIAIEKLREIGIDYKSLEKGYFPQNAREEDDKIGIITQCTMDDDIYRAIAKISLNYLARTQGYEIVLSSSFDAIRKYVRYGEKKSSDFVDLIKGMILENETIDSPAFDGHIFAVYNKGKDMISKVSLFNYIGLYFKVELGRLNIIPGNLKGGHGFDLKEKRLIKLNSGRCKPNV